MVAGKLLILLSSPAIANDLSNPRFFGYSGGNFTNRLIDFSFGWFKTLDQGQLENYHNSINHAIMYAENGQKVSWYKNDASGFSVPVMTWSSGNGYCRRMHIQVIAYNTQKTRSATACFDNSSGFWTWISE